MWNCSVEGCVRLFLLFAASFTHQSFSQRFVVVSTCATSIADLGDGIVCELLFRNCFIRAYRRRDRKGLSGISNCRFATVANEVRLYFLYFLFKETLLLKPKQSNRTTPQRRSKKTKRSDDDDEDIDDKADNNAMLEDNNNNNNNTDDDDEQGALEVMATYTNIGPILDMWLVIVGQLFVFFVFCL
jgi:hypothetical protein